MACASNRIFRIGNRYLIAYLAFIGSFAPISTDMYLPALPQMAHALRTDSELISYSLTSFFFIYAISTLFWGPLSDRLGRRRILLAGTALYFVASVAIALTSSIWSLLLMRAIQAIGAASASAVSLAIVRDVLRGSLMEKVVSLLQAAHIIAPLTAPALGGALLLFTGWRGIFWFLAAFGLLAFLGGLCLSETARSTKKSSFVQAFAAMGHALKTPAFALPLLIFSGLAMPFMSYLAVSTFVFQTWFGLSPQAFSLFFAFNAIFALTGPLAHVWQLAGVERIKLLTFEIAIMLCASCLLLLFGGLSPWAFALLMAPVTFCGAAMRPPSTVLMMQAIRGDNGAVSSLIQCGGLLFGSLSMFLAPLWRNPVAAIGWIGSLSCAFCLAFWLAIRPRPGS